MKLFILHVAIWSVSIYSISSEPIARMQYGKVKGEIVSGFEGDEFYSFRGIPYAKPPIGRLRFSDPEPAEPWRDIRETAAYGPPCAQYYWATNRIDGKEDCLRLNVFTKSTNAGIKRPVMVWIHGGGFTYGSGNADYYGPDYFMRKDIVLVTINYRLGIFGFLSLNHKVAPGNQGMKDQVFALQWVRDNIVNFGGDPNDVTIFGQSAGAMSVHLLTISPLSRGLFHKAIIQSGSVFAPFAYQPKPEELANEILNKLNHTDNDPESSIAFLRTVDAETLLIARNELITNEDKLRYNFGFVPCIDSKSENPFMPVHPEVAAADGILVPLIIGHNSREGDVFLKRINELGDRINEDYPKLFHRNAISILKRYKLTFASLKRIYFGDELATQENSDKMVDLLGEILLDAGIHRTVKIQVEKGRSPTYFYQFTDNAGLAPMKILHESHNLRGAGHGDELLYQFRQKTWESKTNFSEKGSDNYRLMEQMIEMWVNFATTGIPASTPSVLLPFQWLPINSETLFSCLNICQDPRVENVTNIEQKFVLSNNIRNRTPFILRLMTITMSACMCAAACIIYLRYR